MYTNIDTAHAIDVISEYFKKNPRINVNLPAVLDAIAIVMRSGLYQFDDTFWYQHTGTVMGTPPAPMYATLYFAIHETEILPHFRDNLALYKHYIENIFGIWIPTPDGNDEEQWQAFSQQINKFGKL